MAMSPRRLVTSGGPKPSETRPIRLTAFAPTSRSTATMPEDSWPRCWSEYNPRWVIAAACSSPKMPKIPHISVTRHLSELVELGVLDRSRHYCRNRGVIGPPQKRKRGVQGTVRQRDVQRIGV